MFDVTEPRPTRAAEPRGEGRVVAGASVIDAWLDEEPPVRPLSRDEAADLRRRRPSLSPWRVVAWQAAVAVLGAAIAFAASADGYVAASAFYGGLIVAMPGALMARATTRDVTGVHPAAGALSLFAFQAFKLVATLGLLALAPRLVGELHWPALLATLAVGLQTYWLALAVRPRMPSSSPLVHPA